VEDDAAAVGGQARQRGEPHSSRAMASKRSPIRRASERAPGRGRPSSSTTALTARFDQFAG
jgi:hypothetical protein